MATTVPWILNMSSEKREGDWICIVPRLVPPCLQFSLIPFFLHVHSLVESLTFCFLTAAKTTTLLGERSAIVVAHRARRKAKVRVHFAYFVGKRLCVINLIMIRRILVWQGPDLTPTGPIKKIFVGGLHPTGMYCVMCSTDEKEWLI